MPHRQSPPASPWALDYQTCTPSELRKFIKSRTNLKRGKSLRNSQSDKFSLIIRLRKLDQAARFPRFMELPAELRLAVYELLLVDTGLGEKRRNREINNYDYIGGRSKVHPAVALLRASKQVYSEARPVLYNKGNKVGGKVE